MASFPSVKMKRKDLDDVSEDFSEFSLSSPARKIRRLDAQLQLIIDEEETEFKHPLPQIGASNGLQAQLRDPVIEELPPVMDIEERAIVLFKPPNIPLLNSSQNFFVDADLISCIKHQAVWGTHSTHNRSIEDEESKADENLAVIPWVPSQQFHQRFTSKACQSEVMSEPVDSEEMELDQATTEVADNNTLCSVVIQHANENTTLRSTVGMQHHWQQQYCMVPQLPQNTTTSIVWYR